MHCDRIYYSEKALTEHHNNIHLQKKLHCQNCSRVFGRLSNLMRHEKRCLDGEENNHQCSKCKKRFSRLDNLISHQKQCVDNERNYKCNGCLKQFDRQTNLRRHQKICRKQLLPEEQPCGSGIKRKVESEPTKNDEFIIEKIKTAFNNAAITYKIKFKGNNTLEGAILTMKDKLETFRIKEHSLKFSIAGHVEFEKATDADVVTDPPVVLPSEQFEVHHDTDITS